MKNTIIQLLRPYIPQALLNFRRKELEKKLLKDWESNGYPLPAPAIVKQATVREYQLKYGYNILVETGTNFGEMVQAQKKNFKQIISIELGIDLFEKAQNRFRNEKNVTIIQGDSGKVLSQVLGDINEPAIFWLDAHYSSGVTAKGDLDCPILEELDAILDGNKFNHILLIDDARDFVGKNDYPTLDNLSKYIKAKNEQYKIEVKNDIIRCII